MPIDAAVAFTLRPKVDASQAKPALVDHAKQIRESEKAVEKLDKTSKRFFLDTKKSAGDAERAWQGMRRAVVATGDTIVSSLSRAGAVLDKLNAGIDGAKARFLNFRTLFTTGVVGAVTFGGLGKLLEAGRGNLAAEGRVRRQFGDAGLDQMKRYTERLAMVGIGDDDATNALLPIMQAVAETRAGTRYRGRRLTEAQAAAVREQTFGVGARLFSRIATLAPDIDPQSIGMLLAEAGSPGAGAGGAMRLARALGLNRAVVRRVLEANAKGKLGDVLSPDEMKKFGVTGGRLGQGALLDVMLSKAGITDDAADKARSKFSTQIKALSAIFDNTLGDVGGKVLGKLNAGLAKGGNLAEKLQKYLQSPEGAKMIDRISDRIAKVVGYVADLARKVPEVIGFIEAHKDGLLVAGAGFLGLRAYGELKGPVGGILGGIGKLLGRGKGGALEAAGKVLSDADAIPVRVVNWQGGSGAGGALGSILKAGAAPAGSLLTAGAGTTLLAAGGGALGALGSILALGQATAPMNERRYQLRGETQQILDTARMGRVGAIVRAFERAGGAEAVDADVFREIGKPLSAQIGADEGLQAVVQAIRNKRVDDSVPRDLRDALGRQLQGSTMKGIEGIPPIQITVQAPVTAQNAGAFVDAVMPHIEDQLRRKLDNQTGGGLAPAGG